MTSPTSDRARALAEVLEKAGITSDIPEADPNPFWAAQQAFYVCEGSRDVGAWRDLRERLTGHCGPRAAYHRKLAELCHRALRHLDMPDGLREAVAYAWGYFAALLKADVGRNSAGEQTVDA